jgi:hypothetical protein
MGEILGLKLRLIASAALTGLLIAGKAVCDKQTHF